MRHWLPLIACVLLLSACGYKGALVLPKPKPEAKPVPATAPATAPKKEDEDQ